LKPRETLIIEDNVRKAKASQEKGLKTNINKTPVHIKDELVQLGIL
jgi:hypothetical protein